MFNFLVSFCLFKNKARTGDVVQTLECLLCEHLLCKHETLSSNPSPTQNKKNALKNKARAQKGDMRIGKTPKKLVSICCPQHRGTLKATEANRRRGPGTREKVRSKRINLEGNTHAQEINVS
jgi:hypothetical protein